MDQNQTPGGRPAPKKPCFANRFLDDPNIEQTLLMDATNTSEHPPSGGHSLGNGGAKFAPSSLFAAPPADPNGTRNDFDDSLADLTCSFKPTSALFGAQQSPFPQPTSGSAATTTIGRGTPAPANPAPAAEQAAPLQKTPAIPPLQQTPAPARQSLVHETPTGGISVRGDPLAYYSLGMPTEQTPPIVQHASGQKRPAPATPVQPKTPAHLSTAPKVEVPHWSAQHTPAPHVGVQHTVDKPTPVPKLQAEVAEKRPAPATPAPVQKTPVSILKTAASAPKSPDAAAIVTFEDSIHSVPPTEEKPPTRPANSTTSPVDATAAEPPEAEATPMDTTEDTVFGAESGEKPADVRVAEISVLELEKTQEVTLPFLPDVDVQSVVFEAIEAEIGPTGADQTAELSEKLTLIEFLCAEHVTALVKKDPAVAKKTDLVESVRDCVRSLVALGRNASKAKFEAVQAKDRADYDCMMNLEREKTKNIAQEQQLLRSRIAELEDEKQRMEETCTEFQNQIKRLEQLADEADTLEHELIKTRVEKKKLAAQLDAALKK